MQWSLFGKWVRMAVFFVMDLTILTSFIVLTSSKYGPPRAFAMAFFLCMMIYLYILYDRFRKFILSSVLNGRSRKLTSWYVGTFRQYRFPRPNDIHDGPGYLAKIEADESLDIAARMAAARMLEALDIASFLDRSYYRRVMVPALGHALAKYFEEYDLIRPKTGS